MSELCAPIVPSARRVNPPLPMSRTGKGSISPGTLRDPEVVIIPLSSGAFIWPG